MSKKKKVVGSRWKDIDGGVHRTHRGPTCSLNPMLLLPPLQKPSPESSEDDDPLSGRFSHILLQPTENADVAADVA